MLVSVAEERFIAKGIEVLLGLPNECIEVYSYVWYLIPRCSREPIIAGLCNIPRVNVSDTEPTWLSVLAKSLVSCLRAMFL